MTKNDRIVGFTTIVLIVAGLFFVTDYLTQKKTSSASISEESQTQTPPIYNLETEERLPGNSIPLLAAPMLVAQNTGLLYLNAKE